MTIPLIKSGFYREEETRRALAAFVLQTPRFSMGVQCEAFEKAFASKQQRAHAVFVSNGSAANLVLIQSLLNLGRLKKGDRVGFSALTWPTNVMPLLQLGLVPVAIDCEKDTLNVSSRILKDHLSNLQALFLTNVLGLCDDLSSIRQLCHAHNILLLEDNCESLGSMHDSTLLGNFGMASTFSFFVGHHMSTIEGGMICTDDDDLHEMLVMVRAHGWDRNLSDATQQALRKKNDVDDFYAKYTFYDLAYNARPTEIQGFLGVQQLPFIDETIALREKNFHTLHAVIAKNSERFLPLKTAHMDKVSSFSIPVICNKDGDAAMLRSLFEKNDVEVRPIIAGDMTAQPFYKKYADPADCPNAAFLHTHGFYFGNNPELTPVEIQFLSDLLS